MIILRNLRERFYSKPLLREADKERWAKESGMTLPEWEASRRRAAEELVEAENNYLDASIKRSRKRDPLAPEDSKSNKSLNQLKKEEKVARRRKAKAQQNVERLSPKTSDPDKVTKLHLNAEDHIEARGRKWRRRHPEWRTEEDAVLDKLNKSIRDQNARERIEGPIKRQLRKRNLTAHNHRLLFQNPKIRDGYKPFRYIYRLH